MGSIFRKPELPASEFHFKALFLHDLDNNSGKIAAYLNDKWGAFCPALRTSNIQNLNYLRGNNPWSSIKLKDIEKATEETMVDSRDAINYL